MNKTEFDTVFRLKYTPVENTNEYYSRLSEDEINCICLNLFGIYCVNGTAGSMIQRIIRSVATYRSTDVILAILYDHASRRDLLSATLYTC